MLACWRVCFVFEHVRVCLCPYACVCLSTCVFTHIYACFGAILCAVLKDAFNFLRKLFAPRCCA